MQNNKKVRGQIAIEENNYLSFYLLNVEGMV